MPTQHRTSKANPKAPPYAIETLIELAHRAEPNVDVAILDTPGLRTLARSLEDIAPDFRPISRRRAQKVVVESLLKRLRLARYLATYPEIGAIQLKTPIFLISPPRTGTTFLHQLLCQDPAHRAPRIWEVLQAAPPEPDYRRDPQYFEKDYRIPIAQTYLETRNRFSPTVTSIHPTSVDAPEECFGLIETSLLSHSFMFCGPVLDYLAWLDEQEDEVWRQAYTVYADQLRLLHWWWPGDRWVLKSPFHLWALDAIFAQFPDAIIVQQHRNPATCVASFCSLTADACRPLVSSLDNAQIGRIAFGYLRKAVARNSDQRQRLDPSRFIDIDYRDLIADPIGCVRTIYQTAGTELSPEIETRMRDYLVVQQQDRKQSTHQYTLAEYHLTEEEVTEGFAPYNAFNPRQAETSLPTQS